MSAKKWRIIQFPKITDRRGNLTFIEGERHIPFSVKRVFYVYDVPAGVRRGGHALRRCHQLLIPSSGSFDVIVDDGREKERYSLNLPYRCLYIPPFVWREMENFSSNSMCTVLASEFYAEADYYRDYGTFLEARDESL